MLSKWLRTRFVPECAALATKCVFFPHLFRDLCRTACFPEANPLAQDRRPLAPAAIAKLVVTDKDNRVIPPESA
jgi:hypothetical protein